MDAYMNPKCTNPNTVIEQSICLCIVSECHFGVVSRFDCMYNHSECHFGVISHDCKQTQSCFVGR